jgi:hypothetical protein
MTRGHDYFVGIDPGATGGICLIDKQLNLLCVAKFDASDSLLVCEQFIQANNLSSANTFVALEKVHSFPGQGVASSFKFGMEWGRLQGYFQAHRFSVGLYAPQEWQRVLPPAETGKGRIMKYAIGLDIVSAFMFPRCRVPHSGCLDAFGICFYAASVASGAVERSAKSMKPAKKRSQPMRM